MKPIKANRLRLVGSENSGITPSQTKIFLEVAANPQKALKELHQTNPELAADIQARLDDAMERNRRANAGRFIIDRSDI